MDLVVFEIDGRRYGLPAADVREIVRAVSVSPLPGAPPVVEGLINVRGALVPVLDLRARFAMAAKDPSHTDHLLLASAGTRLVAIRADRALDLAQVDPADVENATAIVPDAQYLRGVAKLTDGLVLIHDLRTFLKDTEALSLDDALSAVATPTEPRPA
jgi:purine-binding chemotaxis protein CheW